MLSETVFGFFLAQVVPKLQQIEFWIQLKSVCTCQFLAIIRGIPLYVRQGLSTQLHRTGQQFRWSQVLGSETEISV